MGFFWERTAWSRRRVAAISLLCGAAACGCGVFSSSFLAVIDPTGGTATASIDNAPGHVVVQFINNAQVDEMLLNYLLTEGGVNLSDAEIRNLRPRVRLRMQITYRNGQTLSFEIVDGSQMLVDSRFQAQADADLNQNDLDNAVARCDVARVEIAPGSSIEVFIPVELLQFDQQQMTVGNNVVTEYILRDRIPPQFRVLQADQVDQDGNVVLQSNIGIRDFPSPVLNPVCGTVVAVIMNGTLRVPFLAGVPDPTGPGQLNDPSFDVGDASSVASIGGRYEFLVTVVGR